MDLGITDKVAAVAAASTGLGFAVARELVREGARVFLCSRSRSRVDDAVAALRAEVDSSTQKEPRVAGAAVDLASAEGPAEFLARAREHYGPVDILVANNGGPAPGPPVGLGDDAWEAGFRLTFQSSQRLAEGVVADMRRRGWGRIIFITSVSVKQPIYGLTISTALRSAVVGYSKCLSDELAVDGITVNCAAPGSTATERLEHLFKNKAEKEGVSLDAVKQAARDTIPAGRFGRPDEFAAAVAFLASERASYITGVVLPIDGGVVRSLT